MTSHDTHGRHCRVPHLEKEAIVHYLEHSGRYGLAIYPSRIKESSSLSRQIPLTLTQSLGIILEGYAGLA